MDNRAIATASIERGSPDDRLAAYSGDRPEVRGLVPARARRVLDLGCAVGDIGAALKLERAVEVVGVELDPAFAARARERLDRVVEADIEELLASEDSGLGRFDCVIAADILEHLRDPWATLARAVELLDPGGTAVVSLPNIRFFRTFVELGLHGTWPRRDFGLFDRTHLRWFTLRDARELVEGAGLRVAAVTPVVPRRPDAPLRDRIVGALARTPLHELLAVQYVLAGARPGEG